MIPRLTRRSFCVSRLGIVWEGTGAPEDWEFEVGDGEAEREERGGVGHGMCRGLEGVVYVEGDEGCGKGWVCGAGFGQETVPEEKEACRVDAA